MMSEEMDETETLARYATGLGIDLPKDVIAMTKRLFRDFLGYSLAGSREDPARIILEVIKKLGGRKESTIIGIGKTSSLYAALVNGTMAHTCELDDSHVSSRAHVGDSVIPAALAVAESEGASGRELIPSLVAGYDVAIRIAKAVMPSHYLWWHPSGTINTFGAAAAAGKILRLDVDGMVNALGIAGTQAAGIWQPFHSKMAFCKDFHPGKAAMNGVLAALLAQAGFTGGSEIIEGKEGFCEVFSDEYDLKKVTEGLGKDFTIMEVEFKPYSACRLIHSVIDATLEVMEKYKLSKDDIKEFTVRAPAFGVEKLEDMKPEVTGKYKPYSARFSYRFQVALAISEGKRGLNSILQDPKKAEEKLKDLVITSLMKKINVIADEEMNKEMWTEKRPAIAEVKTKNGRAFSHRVNFAKGMPQNPLTEDELRDKFTTLACSVLSKRKVRKILSIVDELEELEDVRELTRLLH